MGDNRYFWITLTSAALSALLASGHPPFEEVTALRQKAIPMFVVEQACRETEFYLRAELPLQSDMSHLEFEQPEPLHIEPPNPPALPPPPIPFVPQDDGDWTALRMRYDQQGTNIAAIMASTGIIEPPIVPSDSQA